MTKTDRRVQRTRELLQKSLIDLIGERGYDAITIQDIVDRANVARTIFYVHYSSKDDLFLGCLSFDDVQFLLILRKRCTAIPPAPVQSVV